MVYFFSFLCAIAALFPTTVFSQVRCQSIFVNEDLGLYGVNAEKMEPYYMSMFRTHQNVAGVSSGSGDLTQNIYNSQTRYFATVVSQFHRGKPFKNPNDIFIKQTEENINFVLKTYSERRDWTPELRDHLKAEASLYAEQATYIEVRKLNPRNYLPDSLLGTMKIIEVHSQSKIQKLPLEADFSVTMPANAGRKFEPANFVADKEHNKLANSEIFTQLILHARKQLQNPKHEAGKMMYYTPADRLGVKMYAKLGFTSVQGFEAPIKEGSKDWWMIGSSAENLAELPQRLAENRAAWAPEDIDWMNRLVLNFESLQGSLTEREGRISKGVVVEGTSRIKKMGVFLSEPLTQQGKNCRELGIYSMGGGDIELFFRIPEESFPLVDGWSQDHGSLRIFYKDGIFRVLSGLGEVSLTLKTDGSFKKPDYLYLKYRNYKIKADF